MIPDPAQIVRRTQALGVEIDLLKRACASISERRKELGVQAISTALENEAKLSRLVTHFGPSELLAKKSEESRRIGQELQHQLSLLARNRA